MSSARSILKAMNSDETLRSILVSNISPGTKEEAIVIHFQQRKHGGGDVSSVKFTQDGDTAVIAFEEEETVKTVLNEEHKIGGVLLKVDRCPEKRKAAPDQVFSQVTAMLDPFDFGIQLQEAQQILEKIKVEVGISFEYSGKCFEICGTLSQINECHVHVKKYLSEDENISDELSMLSVEAKAQTNVDRSEMGGAAEASPTGKNSDVIIATLIDENPEGKDLPTNSVEADKAKRSANPTITEIQTFKLDPLAIRFMSQFFNEHIHKITEKCLVEFFTSNGGTQITLQPKHDCDPARYKEACSEIFMLIDSASQGMVTQKLDLKDADEDSVDALIQYIATRYPVIVDRPQEHGPCVVYGDAASVRQVKRTVQGGMSEQVSYDTSIGAEGMEAVTPEGVSIETFNHRTEKGIIISLRYGDITDEKVDAIVNPANDFLSHGAGLARLIVQKGGSEIQRESDRLIRKRGFQSLHVGDAVHTIAGRLPSKFVIHAVGPEWNRQSDKKSKKLIQKACFESLKLASKLGLSSVALPAISSGIFRAPLDACAFAMLNAVEEYVAMPSVPNKEEVKKKASGGTTQNKTDVKKPGKKKEGSKTNEGPTKTSGGEKDSAKPGGLYDIRFVLIDADTMDVFEKEFNRRFGSGLKDISDDDDDEV
ncbi:hypothetical protein ACROYT_G011270 [Oculina patagonica]